MKLGYMVVVHCIASIIRVGEVVLWFQWVMRNRELGSQSMVL